MKNIFFLAIILPLLLCKVHASQGVCKIEYAMEPSSYRNHSTQDPLDIRDLQNLLNNGNIGTEAAKYIATTYISDNNYNPDGLLPPLENASEKIIAYVICAYRIVSCHKSNNSDWTIINEKLKGNPFTYPTDKDKMEKAQQEMIKNVQARVNKVFKESLDEGDHTDVCKQQNNETNN